MVYSLLLLIFKLLARSKNDIEGRYAPLCTFATLGSCLSARQPIGSVSQSSLASAKSIEIFFTSRLRSFYF